MSHRVLNTSLTLLIFWHFLKIISSSFRLSLYYSKRFPLPLTLAIEAKSSSLSQTLENQSLQVFPSVLPSFFLFSQKQKSLCCVMFFISWLFIKFTFPIWGVTILYVYVHFWQVLWICSVFTYKHTNICTHTEINDICRQKRKKWYDSVHFFVCLFFYYVAFMIINMICRTNWMNPLLV